MEMLISTKGSVIAAKQSNSTANVSESSPETLVAKVIGTALFQPKGYPSNVRLVVEADGKRYKVSNWEECSPEQVVYLMRQSAEIEEKSIYWYTATNKPLKGE